MGLQPDSIFHTFEKSRGGGTMCLHPGGIRLMPPVDPPRDPWNFKNNTRVLQEVVGNLIN